MPRLRSVPRDEAAPGVRAIYEAVFGDRDPVAQPGTSTGTPGNWWTVFAGSPDVLMHAMAGFTLLNSGSRKLSAALREVALVRTGFLGASRFVFSQHSKLARAVELSEEKIAGIPAWTSCSAFDATERAVLAYVDELVLADGRVHETTFAKLREHLSDEEILELSYGVGTYRMHAMLSRAFRLEYDDVDEPVREVPAPAGFDPKSLASALRGK